MGKVSKSIRSILGGNRVVVWVAVVLVSSQLSFATLEEAERAEQESRDKMNKRFEAFTGSNNVLGKPTDAKGQNVGGGQKGRYNQNDKVPYNHPLTYHKNTFKKIERKEGGGKNETVRILYEFVSEHGGIDASGGSSKLEREIYKFHEQYSKEEKSEDQKKREEQEGVRNESILKITTKQVEKQESGGKKEEPDKIERKELRPEVAEAASKVGEESGKNIERLAKGPGFENDAKTMGNIGLYYEDAKRSTQAWWDSTLAALGERRAFKAIRGAGGEKVELTEEKTGCNQWKAEAEAKLAQEQDPQRREQLQQELDRMQQQCDEVAKTNFRQIAPKFKKEDGGGGGGQGGGGGEEKLQFEGVAKEDDIQRDLRNQLEVLQDPTKQVDSLQTNFKYEEKDKTQKIAIGFDGQGNATNVVDWTPKDQLDSYNAQLDDAKKGFQEVATRTQITPPENLDQFKKGVGSGSAMETNDVPYSIKEELGVPQESQLPKPAESYTELINQNLQ